MKFWDAYNTGLKIRLPEGTYGGWSNWFYWKKVNDTVVSYGGRANDLLEKAFSINRNQHGESNNENRDDWTIHPDDEEAYKKLMFDREFDKKLEKLLK